MLTSDGSGNLSWSGIPAPSVTNGLSLIGSDIGLGGTLTDNTTITVPTSKSNNFHYETLDNIVGYSATTFPVYGTLYTNGSFIRDTQNDGTTTIFGVFDTGYTGYKRPDIAFLNANGKTFEFNMQKNFGQFGYFNEITLDGSKLRFTDTGQMNLYRDMRNSTGENQILEFANNQITLSMDNGVTNYGGYITLNTDGITLTSNNKLSLNATNDDIKLTTANNIVLDSSSIYTSSGHLVFGSVAHPVDTITLNGYGGNTCVLDVTVASPSCSSDERLKTNIEDLTIGTLDKLLNLKTISYNWNNFPEKGTQIGFLAQDLEQYFPSLVSSSSNGFKTVSYGGMTPILVQAIREMNLKIITINDMETPNSWRDALIAWFGNVGNGIVKLFANEIETKNLCVADDNGGKTCITKAQLDQLLNNAVGGSIAPAPAPSPDPVPDPGTGGGTVEGDSTTGSGVPTDTPSDSGDTSTDTSTPSSDPILTE